MASHTWSAFEGLMYVDEANPDTNYNDEGVDIYVGYSAGKGDEWRCLAGVDFSAHKPVAGSTITKAVLKLFQNARASEREWQSVSLADTWDDDTVTWNNKPIDASPLVTQNFTQPTAVGQLVELDVLANFIDIWDNASGSCILRVSVKSVWFTDENWGDFNRGGGELYVEWTPPAGGNVGTILGVDWANVKTFAGVTKANVKKVGGVSAN